MQLSKVVGAILKDLSAAQDLANEYSSQLSYKYKKKQVVCEDDNVLSNFQVPSAVLGQVSLDLKFVIKEIDPDGCALDVDNTQGKCYEIGRRAAMCLLLSCGDGDLAVPIDSSNLEEEIEEERNSQSNKVAKIVLTPEFKKKLEIRVCQGLFRLCQRVFMFGNDLTESEIKDTIADQIEDELLKLEEIQDLLKISNCDNLEEVESVEETRKQLKEICRSCADSATEEIDLETLIQKVRGSPNTDVIVDLETLKEMPIEAIQSLRISAKYDNCRWTIK